MPDWWFEAALLMVVFGTLFVVWVVLPPPAGETDLASKIRDWIRR
jgi:hypothetical protein